MKGLPEDNRRLVNLTGQELLIVNNHGNVLRRLRNDGMVIVDTSEELIGFASGVIELVRNRIPHIRGLPPAQSNCYYIVKPKVAWAAAQTGRPVRDLLVPTHPHRLNNGTLIGYQALTLGESLFGVNVEREEFTQMSFI